tara:strand:+ start:1366 stop:1728 length:363 start_codon:yes stop_codon:yes gene_type:complete
MPSTDSDRLDHLVAEARRNADLRSRGYRERALKLFPWICARCGREFTRANLSQLTVHHRDHNHDHNPPDGSNWELLCIYCHDNEHQREVEVQQGNTSLANRVRPATHTPFAELDKMLNKD